MAITNSVPTRSWRVENLLSGDAFGTTAIQPHRLDVIVHLCAIDVLAGTRTPLGGDVDWLHESDRLADRDDEPNMAAQAAAVLSGEPTLGAAVFGSGGYLLRGATHAAAALASGTPLVRREGTGAVADRTLSGLEADGWAAPKRATLRANWLDLDSQAGIVAVPADNPERAHEFECRFPLFDRELRWVAQDQSTGLRQGSWDLLFLRGNPTTIAAAAGEYTIVIDRPHAQAIAAGQSDPSPSAAHQRIVRERDRVERRRQLLDRLRRR